MRTQSIDTSPEAERILITMIRLALIPKRFRLVQSLSQFSPSRRNQGRDPREVAVDSMSRIYGRRVASLVLAALADHPEWQEQPVDLAAILVPVMQALVSVGIASYIGGSIASSVHGMQQTARDIDLVISRSWQEQRHAAFELLRDGYLFVDTEVVSTLHDPLKAPHRFSLIHLGSLYKVDIIVPQAGMGAFDERMREQVVWLSLDERYSPLPVTSAHEMILWKVYRFAQEAATRQDGMVNDAEWNDILGMLKVQGPVLDQDALRSWAAAFHMELEDAGSMMEAHLEVPARLLESLKRYEGYRFPA